VFLHIGATTPAGVAVTVTVIFLLIFAMSFAFGSVPEGRRRFSREWTLAWLRASLPRMVIAGAFAGIVLAGALAYGGNSTQAAINCDRGVPPITGTAVTDARILLAIDSLSQMTDAANQGQVDKLRTIWLTTDAHNLTHDIDGPLRKEDANLAKSLCEKVVALENQMVGQIVTSVVANQAQVVGDALQQARPLLRENGSSPTPVIVQTCDLPVGAVTTQPLTETRLTGAIAQLRQASTLAAAGDGDGAQAAFSGDAHNLTHDIDGPLRTGDHDLAVNLCKAVVDIEQHLGANYDASVMQDQASTAADMIEQGGRELGILQ
jgi:hypothetical protein